MTRPNLEGLFTGATPADPPMSWLNGTPAPEKEAPAGQPSAAPSGRSDPAAPTVAAAPPPRRPAPPAGPTPPAATGLLDPIALAERYFTMMQALLDLQRDVGMRLAQQVATLPPMNRFRH